MRPLPLAAILSFLAATPARAINPDDCNGSKIPACAALIREQNTLDTWNKMLAEAKADPTKFTPQELATFEKNATDAQLRVTNQRNFVTMLPATRATGDSSETLLDEYNRLLKTYDSCKRGNRCTDIDKLHEDLLRAAAELKAGSTQAKIAAIDADLLRVNAVVTPAGPAAGGAESPDQRAAREAAINRWKGALNDYKACIGPPPCGSLAALYVELKGAEAAARSGAGTEVTAGIDSSMKGLPKPDEVFASALGPIPSPKDNTRDESIDKPRIGERPPRHNWDPSRTKPEDADRALTDILRNNPNDADALAQRGRARALMGNREGALADLNRALALDANNAAAKLIKGNMDSLSQVEGRSGLGKIKGFLSDPGDGGALGANLSGGAPRRVSTALVNQGGQSYAQASAVSFPAPGQAGVGPTASALSAAPTRSGFGGVSIGQIELPHAYRAMLERASQKLRLGDFKGALLDATLAIDQNPNFSNAWALRAEIDNALKNYAATYADAGKALGIEPMNGQALRALAYAHLQEGNYKAAFDAATLAVQADPQSGLAYLYRAMAAEKLGDVAGARRDLETAVRLDPALKPLAEESLGHLYATAPKPGLSEAVKKKLVRGGALALSLLLVLYGLLGTERGRQTITTAKRLFSGGASPEALSPNGTLPEGAVLGGTYRVVREIGRGGMGIVYEAFDEALRRRVAVKQLQKDNRTTRSDIERFLTEARLAAQLKHPNLAQIHAAIEDGDLYLVFEYIQGQGLDQLLSTNGALPLKRARMVLADVCAAVDYAHSQRIIHRDLKPANVMLADDGACKVMDFGIAHQSRTASGMTQATAAGTPPYMAPEQAMGSVSKASDLYALGVMAYELSTGTRPFDNQGLLDAKLRKDFPKASTRRESLPPAMDAVFDRALEPDPLKRFSSAREFLKAFDAFC